MINTKGHEQIGKWTYFLIFTALNPDGSFTDSLLPSILLNILRAFILFNIQRTFGQGSVNSTLCLDLP